MPASRYGNIGYRKRGKTGRDTSGAGMKYLIMVLVVAVVAPASAEIVTSSIADATPKRQGVLGELHIHVRDSPATASAHVDWVTATGLFENARALERQSKINDAIEVYRLLIKAHPGLPEPYNNLGLLHLLLGQYEMAESAFEDALRIQPDYSAAQESLGDVHARVALRAYGTAARLEPEIPFASEKFTRLAPILHAPNARASMSLSKPIAQSIDMVQSD